MVLCNPWHSCSSETNWNEFRGKCQFMQDHTWYKTFEITCLSVSKLAVPWNEKRNTTGVVFYCIYRHTARPWLGGDWFSIWKRKVWKYFIEIFKCILAYFVLYPFQKEQLLLRRATHWASTNNRNICFKCCINAVHLLFTKCVFAFQKLFEKCYDVTFENKNTLWVTQINREEK